jgi:hypothetical protein
MTMASTVGCRANGCTRTRRRMDVLCRPCWYGVPEPLRDEIWRLYRTAQGSLDHLRAVAEAVRIAEEKLAA